jgi:hypothetical protein
MPAFLQALELEDEAAFARLLAFADANRMTADQLRAIGAGDRPPVRDYPEHRFVWPVGFLCVFSIELQPNGAARHLAVSVYDKSDPEPQMPAPHAMNVIAKAFGFKDGAVKSWMEESTMSFHMAQLLEG